MDHAERQVQPRSLDIQTCSHAAGQKRSCPAPDIQNPERLGVIPSFSQQFFEDHPVRPLEYHYVED